MISFLVTRLGLSEALAKIVGYVVLPLVVLGLFYWFVSSRINNYGDRREAEGVAKERSAWEEASKKLEKDAAASATKADDRAAVRLQEYKEQADEDRKAVDDAVANGTSPLDALFGG